MLCWRTDIDGDGDSDDDDGEDEEIHDDTTEKGFAKKGGAVAEK